MRPTVLLFDIDGTVITGAGTGRRAISRAFLSAHGRADACDHFSFSGMTDRAIVRGGLQAIGAPATEPAISAVIDEYLRCLEDEVQAVSDDRFRVHAGIEQAITAGHRAGHAVGLGTGNVRAGAITKLKRVGLHERFDFGGFGDDHELRAELIRVGAVRGATKLQLPLEEVRVVVIGDTPKDVAAAQAIGAECLAVATGDFQADQLRESGATFVFEDLTVPGALDALLVGDHAR